MIQVPAELTPALEPVMEPGPVTGPAPATRRADRADPVARAEAACQRARLYGNHRYVGVKRILEKGLDLEELPETQPPSGLLTQPRFARAPEAYLPVAGEVPHVTH